MRVGKRAFFAGFGGFKKTISHIKIMHKVKSEGKTILHMIVSTKKYFGDKKCA